MSKMYTAVEMSIYSINEIPDLKEFAAKEPHHFLPSSQMQW